MAIGRNMGTLEFLSEQIYLPGYMAVREADLCSKRGDFLFDVKEPRVTRGDIVNYFTPRGLHICVSQAGYTLMEHLAGKELLGDLDVNTLRKILLQGRGKITELYQKFRKEVELTRPLSGTFDITQMRLGKTPVMKMDFEFGSRKVEGYLTLIIAPSPTPQLNQDILRFQIK